MHERQQPDVAKPAAHRRDHAAPIRRGIGDPRRLEQRERRALRDLPLGTERAPGEIAEQLGTRRAAPLGSAHRARRPRARRRPPPAIASPCSSFDRSVRALSSPILEQYHRRAVPRSRLPIQVTVRRYRRARPRVEPGLPALGARRRDGALVARSAGTTRSTASSAASSSCAATSSTTSRRSGSATRSAPRPGSPSWKLASCIRATEIFRGDQVVLRAQTTWAFMALATARPTKIPDELRALFG